MAMTRFGQATLIGMTVGVCAVLLTAASPAIGSEFLINLQAADQSSIWGIRVHAAPCDPNPVAVPELQSSFTDLIQSTPT